MDLTGLYNAIMQLIFIITGLVSIKSLTEMITQLVGQGDALKDGADTMKEAKKMAGQAAGAAIHAGGLAVAGVRGVAGVAKTVAGSPAATRLKEKASDAKGWVGDKWDDYVDNSRGSTDKSHWVGRRAANRRDRIAKDDIYINQEKRASDFALKAQEYKHMARDLRNKGDTAGASWAEGQAALFDKRSNDASQIAGRLRTSGNVSLRGKLRGDAETLSFGGKVSSQAYKQAVKEFGFEDGVGVKAMLKGDKNANTAINKFMHTGGDSSVYNNIKNTNKFIFNVTGMKGDVKDFLDNADVLETIEAGDTALARQMRVLVSHTGAKSDLKKAEQSAEGQAKATAKQMAAQTSAINSTMASISQQLEEIKKKLP